MLKLQIMGETCNGRNLGETKVTLRSLLNELTKLTADQLDRPMVVLVHSDYFANLSVEVITADIGWITEDLECQDNTNVKMGDFIFIT